MIMMKIIMIIIKIKVTNNDSKNIVSNNDSTTNNKSKKIILIVTMNECKLEQINKETRQSISLQSRTCGLFSLRKQINKRIDNR